MNFYLSSEQESERFGINIADIVKPPLIIGWQGEIGMGKTTIIRAMLKNLGVKSAVKSPTFNLVESYQTKLGVFYHFDLYRLKSLYELEDLGFRDYLLDDPVCCIEWPANAPLLMPLLDVLITIELSAQGGRNVHISAQTSVGKQFLHNLAAYKC